MTSPFRRASMAGTGSFIPNGRLEEILGPLDRAPPRVQSFIRNLGPRMLESGGVEHRDFAIDPATRRLAHTTASLAEQAARKALEYARKKPGDLNSSSSPAPSRTT